MPGVQGGLQDFLRQRQSASQESRREEIQKNFKVSVPVTKLEHTRSLSLTQRPGQSRAPSLPPAQEGLRHQVGLRSGRSSNGQGDGFDTDAEGLDDTTVASSTYDNGVTQNLVLGLSHGASNEDRDEGSTYQSSFADDGPNEERLNNGRYNDARTKEMVFGGESESYEESEYEEEGRYEEDIEQELTEDVLKGLDSPGYLQFQQQRTSLSKEEALKSPIQSIAPRNGRRNTVEDQIPSTPKPFPWHLHNGGGQKVALGANLQRQNQDRRSITKEDTPLAKEHRTRDRPSELRKEPDRTAVQRTMPVRHLSLKQPSAIMDQPQSESPEGPAAETHDGTEVKANQPIRGEGRDLLLANVPVNAAAAEDGRDEAGNELSLEVTAKDTVSRPNSNAAPNENELFFGKDLSKDTSNDNNSAKPESAQTAQKRSRDLDYSQDQLASMNFQQLKDEAFHLDPQASKVLLPAEIESGTLIEKLDFLVKIKEDDERKSQQSAFLKSLPIEEYEECGDIIVDRFSEMVKRFKQARQERRKAAREFESEVARREESVRGKIDAFEKDFSRLKQSGEDVVRKRLAM